MCTVPLFFLTIYKALVLILLVLYSIIENLFFRVFLSDGVFCHENPLFVFSLPVVSYLRNSNDDSLVVNI